MVAYLFHPDFETLIRDRRETTTIRRISRKRHARRSETLQLYIGMRTRHCRKAASVTSPGTDIIRIAGAAPGDIRMTCEDGELDEPAMIEEATKNAREAAGKFAEDSGSRVGKIRRATQGYFSISERDRNSPDKKVVRVVTTVEYYLID